METIIYKLETYKLRVYRNSIKLFKDNYKKELIRDVSESQGLREI